MSRALRLGLTLGTMFLLGIAAAHSGSAGTHFGHLWPAGLASGALVISGPGIRLRVGTLIAVLATASLAIGGYPFGVSLGYGVGIAVEAGVAARLLRAERAPSRREPSEELIPFARACLAGAATGALWFGVVALIAGYGDPLEVGIAVLCTHLVSQAVLLAVFRPSREPAAETYAGAERPTVWLLTVAVTVAAFVPDHAPGLAFLLIPLLGWVAFRATTREAALQLTAVAVIASTLDSRGFGPFNTDSLPARFSPELIDLPLQAFLAACVMVTVPFSITVSMWRQSSRQASHERARSDLLVRSAVGIALIGTDARGRINAFSPGAEAVLGYRAEEVIGRSPRMFHTPAELHRQATDLGTATDYLAIVRAAGQAPAGTARDWEFIRSDGVPRILSTMLSPVTDQYGSLIGYVATADDVTDRIAAHDALEKALEAERTAVAQLREIDETKDAFVSTVSHELRTPITNIVGYLELLRDGVYGVPTGSQSDALGRIDSNATRLLMLIDDLLALSATGRDSEPERSLLDLALLVHRTVDLVRPSLAGRDLDLVLDLPPGAAMVSGSAAELERLLLNLLTNAVKFTPDGGRISVTVREGPAGAGPVLLVGDTGVGISELDQEKLFTRFYRSEHARQQAIPGTGLGLAIVKAIAERHGATVTVESALARGTSFAVSFPAADLDRATA